MAGRAFQSHFGRVAVAVSRPLRNLLVMFMYSLVPRNLLVVMFMYSLVPSVNKNTKKSQIKMPPLKIGPPKRVPATKTS